MTATLTTEQAKQVMEQVNVAFRRQELMAAASSPNAVKCWSCKIGINAAAGLTIAAAIAAAVATGGAALIPEVATIAAVTGLSEAVVSGIITSAAAGGAAGGAAAVEGAIDEICKATGACSG